MLYEDLDPDQQAAVELISTAKMAVVTGGPGTGKTTCLTAALGRIGNPSFRLCAPTGKAARRMTEVTGREAFTIHRMLGYRGDHFEYNEDNKLQLSRVIVDEASMVDVQLCASLFRALPDDCAVIFIGDADQLPSVQPGYMFGDLINSGRVPVVRLKTLHRAAQKSWVCANAPKLIKGYPIDKGAHDDFVWMDVGKGGQHALIDLVVENRDMEMQVLIPQKKGPLGVFQTNRMLQQRLNPYASSSHKPPSIPIGPIGEKFRGYQGDRVINTKNDYKTGVMNGEIGTIESIFNATTESGNKTTSCTVQFEGHYDGTTVITEPTGLHLAYALTIHKSQGSEWPWVLVVCHSEHNYMLCRQLIYTGITRSQEGVILIGNEAGVKRATENDQPAKRKTMLRKMLVA